MNYTEASAAFNLTLVSVLLLQNIRLVQLLTKELAEEGYAGVEVRVTPLRTEIIISATRPQNVLGEKGQRIRELTSVVQKRCVIPTLLFDLTEQDDLHWFKPDTPT